MRRKMLRAVPSPVFQAVAALYGTHEHCSDPLQSTALTMFGQAVYIRISISGKQFDTVRVVSHLSQQTYLMNHFQKV